jgi:hypothetical protein
MFLLLTLEVHGLKMNQFKILTMLFNYLTQNSSHTEMNQLHVIRQCANHNQLHGNGKCKKVPINGLT